MLVSSSKDEVQHGQAHAGEPSSFLPSAVPPLPVELLEKIFGNLVSRKDLATLHLVSKCFRELAAMKLYHTFLIAEIGDMERLFLMARDPVKVAAIKVIRVHIPFAHWDSFTHRNIRGPLHAAWGDQVPLLVLSLPLLVHLHTLEIHPFQHIPLDAGLQLAITSHPTLRHLLFDSWALDTNSLLPLGPRRLPSSNHPLLVAQMTLSSSSTISDEGFFREPQKFLAKFKTFADHFDVRVGTLDLHTPFDDNDYSFSRALADLTLPGLHTLRIHSEFPETFTTGPWISSFLRRHPTLKEIQFDPRGNWSNPAPLVGLLVGLAKVEGLEAFGRQSEATEFLREGNLSEMTLELVRNETGGAGVGGGNGSWTLVGLRLKNQNSNPTTISPSRFASLNDAFPLLERLELIGAYEIDTLLSFEPTDPTRFLAYSTFLNSLPIFPHLKHLVVPGPCSLLFQQQGCMHNLHELNRSIDDDDGSFGTGSGDVERFKAMVPSPCLVGKEPFERVPRRTMRILESLARRMSGLETLGWAMEDVEQGCWNVLIKWKVAREERDVRLVFEDQVVWNEEEEESEWFKKQHTGWISELQALVDGAVEVLGPDEEEEGGEVETRS